MFTSQNGSFVFVCFCYYAMMMILMMFQRCWGLTVLRTEQLTMQEFDCSIRLTSVFHCAKGVQCVGSVCCVGGQEWERVMVEKKGQLLYLAWCIVY